ncbi:hypothetical protein AVEN_107408-1, partial [Araneus ventricosus]
MKAVKTERMVGDPDNTVLWFDKVLTAS